MHSIEFELVSVKGVKCKVLVSLVRADEGFNIKIDVKPEEDASYVTFFYGSYGKMATYKNFVDAVVCCSYIKIKLTSVPQILFTMIRKQKPESILDF